MSFERMSRCRAPIGGKLAVAAVATLVVAIAAGAARADSGFVAPREEIPLTYSLSTGARSLGMGGIGVAVAEDATAISLNPACMARLQRIEVSGEFRHSSSEFDGSMSGDAFESSFSHTDISALRAAYPFPTFRGSLVLAVAAERLYDFTDDRLAAYEGEIAWTEPPGDPMSGDWAQVEDYIAEGGIYAFTAGAAVDISPSIALGAAVSYYSGDYAYTFRWDLDDVNELSDAYDDVTSIDEYSTDVSGLRATVGTLFYVSDRLSLGLTVDTPLTLTFDGRGDQSVTANGGAVILDQSSFLFSDEVTLPFSFRAGAALSPVDLLMLGADVGYTEWSEMAYEGPLTQIVEEDGGIARESIYEGVIDYAIGLEATIPNWPVRLRAGYASRPIPYRGLDIDSDRSVFSLGAGAVIDGALALDVAWLQSAFERSDARYEHEETATDRALVIEATYRF